MRERRVWRSGVCHAVNLDTGAIYHLYSIVYTARSQETGDGKVEFFASDFAQLPTGLYYFDPTRAFRRTRGPNLERELRC